MTESILNSVKICLGGIEPDVADFDNELIIHINSILRILYRLGLGQKNFRITGPDETWDAFLTEDADFTGDMAAEYVALKIKYFWDPPISGAATQALKEQIDELEFTLNIFVDPGEFP